jgi:hypothetical protein
MNVFSHLEFAWNFIPWSVRILAKTPNLLITLSKNAYATLSQVGMSLGLSNPKSNLFWELIRVVQHL